MFSSPHTLAYILKNNSGILSLLQKWENEEESIHAFPVGEANLYKTFLFQQFGPLDLFFPPRKTATFQVHRLAFPKLAPSVLSGRREKIQFSL